MDVQVYAIAMDGSLAHAGVNRLLEGIPLAEQAKAWESSWRRWRDMYIADSRPFNYPRKFKQTRDYVAPIDDRKNAVRYVVVDIETGTQLGDVRV